MCFDLNSDFLRVAGGVSGCGSSADTAACVAAGDLGCDIKFDHGAFVIVSCN